MLKIFVTLWSLFNSRERRNAVILVGLMLMQGILELVGIASIVPLITVLIQPSLVETSKALNFIYTITGRPSMNVFLISLSTIILMLTAARAIGGFITNYATVRFTQQRSRLWSAHLLRTYLRQPYGWFLARNTGDLSKNLLSETDTIVQNSLLPALNIIAQGIIVTFIIGLILYLEPVVAAVVSLLIGGTYGAVHFLSRRLFLAASRDMHEANSRRFVLALDILGAIKAIKLAGVEEAYISKYDTIARLRSKRVSQMQILRDIPRAVLEFVAMGGVLIFVIVLQIRSNALSAILPTLAVYVFAGTRLMPALQKIFNDVVQLRSSHAALESFRKEMALDPSPPTEVTEEFNFERSIKLSNVAFTFQNSHKPAINNVSLSIERGSFVAIVGPSGSGKSTLLHIILGLLEPQTGTLLVDDKPLQGSRLRGWHSAIGYVPQHLYLIDDTIAANIALGVKADRIDLSAAARAAQLAQLDTFIDGLRDGLQTKLGDAGVRLSGGQAQRLGIARALYHDPSILILDEATSGLDSVLEKSVVRDLRLLASDKTVIMVTHRISSAAACDQIILLEHGQLTASGEYQTLLHKYEEFRALAGQL